VFLREITVIDAGRESHIYALFDMDKPTTTAPYFEPVSASNLADWCIHGDAVQVDLKEAMNYSGDRYAGLLQDVTLSNIPGSGVYVRECTLRTMQKRGSTGVRFAWFGLSLIMDQSTSISYLATPVYNNPVTLDVPDHKVQVEQTDNPNYLAYKVIGDGSTVNVDIVRETPLGQPVDPYLRISARKTTDVIKWSEVQAVENSDYSEFTARIAADIAAGVAPVVLDDVNDGTVAVLDNINAGGALFRTPANCNERDVVYTDYVITDVAVSRTTRTRNVLFKNASNAYGTDPDGFVEVKNNRNGVYTYSGNTGGNSLDFLADFDNDTAVSSVRFSAVNPPNFAVKIVSTAATDGTVTVYKKQNGLYTPLMPSVAGGTTVEAGKTYQLTCVGDCWTLAEFEDSTADYKMEVGDKLYKVVKIGSLYWMAENLDYKWGGLIQPTLDDSATDPIANYYGYDGNGSEQPYVGNGLLYNGIAAMYLQSHRTELGLGDWRVPTLSDWTTLITNAGGGSTATQALKSSDGWNAGYDGGTNDLGFSAIGHGGFTAGHTDPVSAFTYMNLGDAATFLTSTES
jgi:uncharacterized protein (TIGR02145 family)